MTPTPVLLFLIAFLVGSDEFLLGPLLTPIGADLGVAPERVTLFIGAYALPLALLAPVFGALSDRHGRRAVLLPATALFCLGSLGTALAPGYALALSTRVVTGIGAAGILPVAFACAADSGPDRAPAQIAAVQAGLTGGIILAPAYGAWVTGLFGWQIAFAGLALAAALSLPGLTLLRDGGSRTPDAASTGPVFIPGALGAILAMGLGLGGAVGIYALAGERLRGLAGLETETVGLVYAGFGALTLLGNLLMPRVIGLARDGRQLMRLCLCGVLAAIVALFALPLGLPAACFFMAAWALVGGIGAPALQTYLAGLSDHRRGTLMALGSSALNLGVALWSALAAVGFAHSPLLVAVQALLSIGIAILALRPAPRRATHWLRRIS
ncbi:MFS transporter [Antarcticimicrobium luteum]|uniref:MFS transporter n=1 Tax=Antarcticimicrobium luteum TaxID=2547397 RepID=A0A4R5VAY3_9RHOB|nr:MFS transporter [Antarcticimicrobium luteum]TDK48795.1 MFS transporter [Antarcticimicrobium luteum]